jgi:Ca2+:H+ antiporter
MLSSLLKPSLNWLLVFFPAAIVLEVAHRIYHASWATPTWIFAASALAIIPIAGWMGHATEHLATRLGEGIGGLLNATFGNAAELIIAIMALRQAMLDPAAVKGMHALIKASLTGSIIGNVLLVLGGALLTGGLRHKIQTFNATAGRVNATLLTLAVAALLIPAVTELVMTRHHQNPQRAVGVESLEVSVLLLVAYALSLLFSLHTHKHFYSGGAAESQQTSAPQAAPAAPQTATAPHADHDSWSVGKALGVLVGATVCVAVLAEFMVGSVQAAAEAIGLTELFVGVIVVAIVGNAAEHSTAILVAWNNRMDLSLSIAVGSSIQIALFVAPVLVLLSHAMGVPMDLVFTVPEIVAVALSVLVVDQISGDGESNWLEGVLLVMLYALIGVLFFNLPG